MSIPWRAREQIDPAENGLEYFCASQPVDSLNVRGTWGTSFKAPILRDMFPANLFVSVYENRYLDPPRTLTGMLVYGNGRDLQPEESSNWTAGLDCTPESIEGLSVSATYFHIDYEGRIGAPLASGYDSRGVLLDPLYDLIVTRNPDPAEIARLLAGDFVFCFTEQDLHCAQMPAADEISVIVDIRAIRFRSLSTSSMFPARRPRSIRRLLDEDRFGRRD